MDAIPGCCISFTAGERIKQYVKFTAGLTRTYCSTAGRRSSSRTGRRPSSAGSTAGRSSWRSGSRPLSRGQARAKDEVIAELLEEHVALKKSLGEAEGFLGAAGHARRGDRLRAELGQETETAISRLVAWLGIVRSKFYDWKDRYGQVNEHNAWVPAGPLAGGLGEAGHRGLPHEHPLEGYRRLTYMMMDADIVAVSPQHVSGAQGAGLLDQWNAKPSSKGTGFKQPFGRTSIGTSTCRTSISAARSTTCAAILDGFSRYIVHWEIREAMTEADIEIILQRARRNIPEPGPGSSPTTGRSSSPRTSRNSSGSGGMTTCGPARTIRSPTASWSGGIATLKGTSASVPRRPWLWSEARRVVAQFVEHYNTVRLHSAIGYITPKDKLEGRAEAIIAARTQARGGAGTPRKHAAERFGKTLDKKRGRRETICGRRNGSGPRWRAPRQG